MFNSPFFDSVIAMITLYLLFSQLTLSLLELPVGFLNIRGQYLYNHLKAVLGKEAVVDFYDTATIEALQSPVSEQSWWRRFNGPSPWPAYISETLFAQTLINRVISKANTPTPGATVPTPIVQFKQGLDSINTAAVALATANKGNKSFVAPVDLSQFLLPLYNTALTAAAAEPGQSQALQKNFEAWFHDYGERMTGWYKRDCRWPLFWTGLLVAVLADVDTVRLARFIADTNNGKARTALVETGVKASQGSRPVGPSYKPDDTTEAAEYKTRLRDWNQEVDIATSDLKTTLSSVPQEGLPLGFMRWSSNEQVSKRVARKDISKLLGFVPTDKEPSTTIKQDSVLVHTWAPTADNYKMPVYAQRLHLNPYTGAVSNPTGSWGWLATWGGWLLTAFAMMIGAPFWFDTLCRFVNIRNIGIKPKPAAKK